MKKTLTVLLIEDSADYAALVQQWLSLRTDFTYIVNWADSLGAGVSLLKEGGIDVILLDLGLPDSDGMQTFTRINLHSARVPVILLSADHSEQLALQTVLDGAQDFIVKSSCNGDVLAKAIQYAVVRATYQPEKTGDLPVERATVLGVLGAQGGVGTTTIACALAVELRRQTGKNTLLADLELDGGMVAFLMDAESKYSILDAVRNVDRLDVSFWEGLVVHCSENLDVLPSPSLPGVAEPDAAALQHVLAVIRSLYSWMVVDLGRLRGFSFGLLDNVTDLVLVTTASVPALYEAKRAIAALRKMGFEGNRLKIIVNQLSNTQKVSASQLDGLFGVPVFATFPAACQELHEACVQKKPLGTSGTFSMQMALTARKIAGIEEKPKSRVSKLFSFSGRPASLEGPAS
jgi:Flp pilus assembly CpaE family ATPase